MRKLKEKQQMVMLTEEDLSYITDMFKKDSEEEHSGQSYSEDEGEELGA